MITIQLFRLTLIASYLFIGIGVASSYVFEGTLPETLLLYSAEGESVFDAFSFNVILFILSVMLLIFSALFIGLWCFKSWARWLNVALLMVGMIIAPLLGASVMNGVEAMFDYMTSVLEGALLVMMFTGEIAQRFGSNKQN